VAAKHVLPVRFCFFKGMRYPHPNVFLVQPGMSRAGASLAQLQLLAVTERYPTETYEVPLGVICSS
jgi:hypothetical protein